MPCDINSLSRSNYWSGIHYNLFEFRLMLLFMYTPSRVPQLRLRFRPDRKLQAVAVLHRGYGAKPPNHEKGRI